MLRTLDAVLGRTALPLHAGLLLTAWVFATGALYLDGLADTADAWMDGHGDRERMLAIMKDPHIGPGAVTLVTPSSRSHRGTAAAHAVARSFASIDFVLGPFM